MDSTRKEFRVFTRYLVNSEPTEYATNLYIAAINQIDAKHYCTDKHVNNLILKFPWLTGVLDSGLGIFRKQSLVRQKILIAFCILETQPEYIDYFLPKRRRKTFLFNILFTGVYAVLKCIAGIFLLLFIPK